MTWRLCRGEECIDIEDQVGVVEVRWRRGDVEVAFITVRTDAAAIDNLDALLCWADEERFVVEAGRPLSPPAPDPRPPVSLLTPPPGDDEGTGCVVEVLTWLRDMGADSVELDDVPTLHEGDYYTGGRNVIIERSAENVTLGRWSDDDDNHEDNPDDDDDLPLLRWAMRASSALVAPAGRATVERFWAEVGRPRWFEEEEFRRFIDVECDNWDGSYD